MTDPSALASGSSFQTVATVTAAIAAAAAGGVYLAFSTMVMPSLRARPATEAIATMQRVNELAVRAPFMTVFFGGAAAAAVVVIGSLTGQSSGGVLRGVGAGLALCGFAVTVVANVPRNNALARSAAAGRAPDAWQQFDRGWSRANNLRGVLAMGGAIALTGSLLR